MRRGTWCFCSWFKQVTFGTWEVAQQTPRSWLLPWIVSGLGKRSLFGVVNMSLMGFK